MVVSKYTEDFVKLCVKEHYRTVKYPEYSKWGLSDYQKIKADNEMNEDSIKILFRVEHCEDYHMPAAQVIAEIIDNTIGSNYMKRRPSDEQLRDIIQNHNP